MPRPRPNTTTLEEVVVTAQKRTENLQNVPISIEVLSGTQLEQLDVGGLDGYVKYSPSISYSRGQGQGGNGQPGSSHIYMRGVVSGANENHSGSQPTVGTYFDEQPVTTIDGTPDIHLYDIQRIEVLEGPQGTLYGASSEAGTVRIITNKPDPTAVLGELRCAGATRSVTAAAPATRAEAYVNIPITRSRAVRLVGYYEHDRRLHQQRRGHQRERLHRQRRAHLSRPGGARRHLVQRAGHRTADARGRHVVGARRRCHRRRSDQQCGLRPGQLQHCGRQGWPRRAQMGHQRQLDRDAHRHGPVTLSANGFFGYDPGVGDLQVTHFGPENSDDTFTQSALTVEGKFSDFDLTYAGAFMKRTLTRSPTTATTPNSMIESTARERTGRTPPASRSCRRNSWSPRGTFRNGARNCACPRRRNCPCTARSACSLSVSCIVSGSNT